MLMLKQLDAFVSRRWDARNGYACATLSRRTLVGWFQLAETTLVQERRLASLLVFSWRRDDKLTAGSVHSGFASLLHSLGDIAIDVPDALEHMQAFVGRAQHDGLLPQGWLEDQSI